MPLQRESSSGISGVGRFQIVSTGSIDGTERVANDGQAMGFDLMSCWGPLSMFDSLGYAADSGRDLREGLPASFRNTGGTDWDAEQTRS